VVPYLCIIGCVTGDMVRPLQIDTDSFGKKWGSFKNEKRHKKISSHVKTPEMYMDIVKTKLNLHPIQIIGMWYRHVLGVTCVL